MTFTVPQIAFCICLTAAHAPGPAPRPTKQGWHDVGQGPGSPESKGGQWPTFTDLEDCVRGGVKRIHGHPPVPNDLQVRGSTYDGATGRRQEVH